MKERIFKLRDKLNKEMGKRYPDKELVLKLSQELDALILEYYKNIIMLAENDN